MPPDPARARWTVLATARGFDAGARAMLEERGCHVVQPFPWDADPAPCTLPALLEGVDAWIVGGTEVGRDLLERFPRLRVIARRGVGFEQIDAAAAAALGRVVTIAAGGNAASVADHTVGLMLAVSKRLVEFTRAMRAGDWSYGIGTELHGKTVGIVGLGRVGRLVARRLAGFVARLLATDVSSAAVEWGAANGVETTEMPVLLAEADVVTLHAPLDATTRSMIDAAALARMKRGAILVNTARGGLVDEMALLEALRAGTIAGAGLDVFQAEEDPAQSPTADALLALSNVVGTPHTAAATREGLERTNFIAAQTVVDLLEGRAASPDCVVVDGRSGAPDCAEHHGDPGRPGLDSPRKTPS